MEEFDIDLNEEVGTSVSALKKTNQIENHNIKNTETDIDYDKIMENLNNSEINLNSTNDNINNINKNKEIIPDNYNNKKINVNLIDLPGTKKIANQNNKSNQSNQGNPINMNNFIKTLETDLENFKNINSNNKFYNYQNNNEPLPSNLTKNMMISNNYEKMTDVNYKPDINIKNEPKTEIETKTKKIIKKIETFEYRDIMIFVLLFMLLNNKFIIEIIYNRFPYVKNIESPYPNLIIRSVIFGLLIYGLKKFNL